MTQVNLLPPELRQRAAVRRTTSLVILGGVVLLAIVGFFYVLASMSLSRAEDDLAAQEATNQRLQSQISELQQFATLQAELQQKQQLLQTVFLDEIQWSGVLTDVSRIIPSDSYLTSFTGQISATTTTTPGATTTLVGNLSFSGQALGTDTLASWLTRLDQVKGWVNAWMSSATESGAFSNVYSFTSGVDLTTDALTQRGRGGQQ
ncbi:MAG: PilN domain-containing protein [Candidatus Velamenicoccus archaeovorus]